MAGGKKTEPKGNATSNVVASIEAQIIKNQATYVVGLNALMENMEKQAGIVIPQIKNSIAELEKLRNQFAIERSSLMQEVDTIHTKINEAKEVLTNVEQEYDAKKADLDNQYSLAYTSKISEHRQKLIDADNDLKNQITIKGVEAFKKFLAERNLETVPSTEIAELKSYRMSSEAEVKTKIDAAVEEMRKGKEAEKAIAVNSVKSAAETDAKIKDSEISFLKEKIIFLETEKAKYEALVTTLTAGTEAIVKAAREGGSTVSVDAKTSK